jgi:hypothetical protein
MEHDDQILNQQVQAFTQHLRRSMTTYIQEHPSTSTEAVIQATGRLWTNMLARAAVETDAIMERVDLYVEDLRQELQRAIAYYRQQRQQP